MTQVIRIGNYNFHLIRNEDGTYRSIPEPVPPEEVIVVPKERILGIFDSSSTSGAKHYVVQSRTGEIYCTCLGFKSPNKCWHYRGMMELIKEVGLENLNLPIRFSFNKGGE
jgi:hypothetical protein